MTQKRKLRMLEDTLDQIEAVMLAAPEARSELSKAIDQIEYAKTRIIEDGPYDQ